MRLSNTTLRDGMPGVEAVGRLPRTPPRREPRICVVANDTSERHRQTRHTIRIPVAFDPLDRPEAVPVGRRQVDPPAQQSAIPAGIRPQGTPLDHVA